jgi:hypothetical protein
MRGRWWVGVFSTLDAELRMEQTGVSPIAWALLALAATYLTIKPGAMPPSPVCDPSLGGECTKAPEAQTASVLD